MPATSPCGLFQNEVFVDSNGVYVGEFQIGDGPAGPFGWVICAGLADPEFMFQGIFDAFESPACAITETGRSVYVPIPGIFGVQAARTVADASGPPGLEAVAAMEVDLSGAPEQHLIWAGAQVVDPVTGAWISSGEIDSTTGWNPTPSDTWIFSCWAKVVPDDGDVDISGATLDFTVSAEGSGESVITTNPPLVLSDDWQFYQVAFNGLSSPTGPWCWPVIRFGNATILKRIVSYEKFYVTNSPNPGDGLLLTLQGYYPNGRVRIKCPHLYQLDVFIGNWIDSFHGHG